MSSLSKNDSASGASANAKTPPGSPFTEVIMTPCGDLDGPSGTKCGPPSPATRTRLAEKERDEAKAENAFLREEIAELLLKNKRLCNELTNGRTAASANATADLALLQEEDKELKRLLKEKEAALAGAAQVTRLQEENTMLLDMLKEKGVANSSASSSASVTTTRSASKKAPADDLAAQPMAEMEKVLKDLDAALQECTAKGMLLTPLEVKMTAGPLLSVLEEDFLDFLSGFEAHLKQQMLRGAIFEVRMTEMFLNGPDDRKAKDELLSFVEKKVLALLEGFELKTKEKMFYDVLDVFTSETMKKFLAGSLKGKEGELLKVFELLKAKVVETHLKHKVKTDHGADVEELEAKEPETQLSVDSDDEFFGL